MKKIVFLSAFLMLASSMLLAQKESSNFSSMTAIEFGKDYMIQAEWYYPDDIANIQLGGPSRLAWVTDTANYIEFYRLMDKDDDTSFPIINGDTLIMKNANHNIYLIHTTRSILKIHCIDDAVAYQFDDVATMNNLAHAIETTAKVSSQKGNSTPMKSFFRTSFKQNLQIFTQSITPSVVIAKSLVDYHEETSTPKKAPSIAQYAANPKLHYYELPMSKPLRKIDVDGNCIVVVVSDDEYRVESLHADSTQAPSAYVKLNDQTLEINDPNGGIYYVHTKASNITEFSMMAGCNSFLSVNDQIMSWSDSSGSRGGGNTSDLYLRNSVAEYLDNVAKGASWKQLIEDNQHHMRHLLSQPQKEQKRDMAVNSQNSPRKATKNYDRTKLEYHWGFNNWGTTPFNGLLGMSDPAYDLRTSFSSYQLSYHYNVLMSDHFAASIGLGYESDVYKYSKPYVNYTDGAFSVVDTMGANSFFTTRFTTRYVQLPIGLSFSTKAKRNGFNMKISAIPAIGWCGKHTGLKHVEYTLTGKNQDQTNLKDAINPYKLDVRLDLDFGGLGVFFQVATLPVFIQDTKIYPIKLGFYL